LELDSLKHNQTWILVTLPNDKKFVKSLWTCERWGHKFVYNDKYS